MLKKQTEDTPAMQALLKKAFFFLLALSLFILIDRAAIILADFVLMGSFKYTWLTAHHTIQIFLALAVMAPPFWGRSLSDWGLNLKNHQLTFKILGRFTLGWMFFSTLFTLVTQWLSGWPPLLDFNLSLENILIYLAFESILVGISEELVFRGLVFGALEPHFRKEIRLPGFSISLAGLIAAAFFALAHIGFQLSPFAITAFAPMQIFIALALGTFYAVMREKTSSLLGPVLAHNISDGWLSILYLLIHWLRG
jgi:uncharacterized protein